MSKVNIGLNKLLQALFFELLTALRRIFDTGIYVYIYIYDSYMFYYDSYFRRV